MELRRELLRRTAEDYASARKRIKSQIVDQLVAATGYGRKHAITLLNNPPSSISSSRPRRARYDERVKRALVTLWTTANRICAKRLVPFLPELIEVMERHGHLSLPADVRGKLLTISPATADRLLATERSNQRGMSTTRPGSLLKKQIKVRTFADWDDLQPGFLEADLVAHCGVSAAGSFLHTLVLVDVATGWTECVALLRRSEADVIGALNSLRGRLPVPLLGLDTDNGSEFINYEMLRYCQREQITFTRSRVNRKNDQAFVEEKNGSVVRRLIGYDRYEGLGAWRALIHLYEILASLCELLSALDEANRKATRGRTRQEALRSGSNPLPAHHRLWLSHQAEEGANREFVPEAGPGDLAQRARATPRPFLDLC